MPRTRNNVLAALALMTSLSTLALADASQAQVQLPGGMVAAGRQGPSFQAPRGEFRAQMERRMTERKKDVATVLRLRPDQMTALDALIASQGPRPPAQDLGRAPGVQPGPSPAPGVTLTTPQRLDRQAQRDQARQQMMQQRAQSLRTFYATLSPDQQQVFDAMTRLRNSNAGHMKMRMGGGGRGRGGFGGGGGFPAARAPSR